ncbi:hypothetical protein NST17_01305 [Caldifermentibacillus hisashii]|uniref:Uncharacterized protein n=1 Tax=Caldifermentibacillus hisashii TaxID=996558 RepID=A0ABU9JSQ4_9BACI
MTTKRVLVAVFGRETSFFGDEPCSRHHFEVGNAYFCRRDPFSSPFLVEKAPILTTNPNPVTILGRKTHNFGDEAQSRHHFGAENAQFWRRGPISSPI